MASRIKTLRIRGLEDAKWWVGTAVNELLAITIATGIMGDNGFVDVEVNVEDLPLFVRVEHVGADTFEIWTDDPGVNHI